MDGLRVACCLDAGAKLIAAIWVIIAVWFADNWLIAAAMSAFMVLGAVCNVLTAVVVSCVICFWRARIFAKFGRGSKVEGFLRKPAASSYSMTMSIVG